MLGACDAIADAGFALRDAAGRSFARGAELPPLDLALLSAAMVL